MPAIDSDTLRRRATSAMIDLMCQVSPLHFALRAELKINDVLFEDYINSLDAAAYAAYERSTNRLLELINRPIWTSF